jgi:hypothetical protein
MLIISIWNTQIVKYNKINDFLVTDSNLPLPSVIDFDNLIILEKAACVKCSKLCGN